MAKGTEIKEKTKVEKTSRIFQLLIRVTCVTFAVAKSRSLQCGESRNVSRISRALHVILSYTIYRNLLGVKISSPQTSPGALIRFIAKHNLNKKTVLVPPK